MEKGAVPFVNAGERIYLRRVYHPDLLKGNVVSVSTHEEKQVGGTLRAQNGSGLV